MNSQHNRRTFLRTAAAGSALVGIADLSFLAQLPRVSAQQAQLDPQIVRFAPDIEPLVRLLEDTPREKVVEAFAERIQKGTSYQEVLAALLLAGVRNVEPRPAVGFKFHAVLVVNSAHIASLASPDSDRWLPIFWALDYFKSAQETDERERNWTMGPVNESAVPASHQAKEIFIKSMETWDEATADAAVAALARSASANELFELFARFGCRDFRSIGHKAIFVSNAFRTLHCIGWRFAEPVLRSLAYALLNHTDEPNPAEADLAPDRPFRENLARASQVRKDWLNGTPDDKATLELLGALRAGSVNDACTAVVDLLNRGVAPQSIQDSYHEFAIELLMRQQGIVALHAVTTTNAMHHAFQTSADENTRLLLLLQNAAFLPLFLQGMRERGEVAESKIEELVTSKVEASEAAIAEIFHDVSSERTKAAEKLLGYLDGGGDPQQVIQAARRLVFLKGTDSHDYKFSSAVLEDYYKISPQWRNRYLAASVFNLRGTDDQDNGLVQRTRSAFEA